MRNTQMEACDTTPIETLRASTTSTASELNALADVSLARSEAHSDQQLQLPAEPVLLTDRDRRKGSS